ncbi:MAG: RidA family protein [Halobacteriaceae archaeon]
MRKIAVLPGMSPDPDRESVEPQMCYAVATEREGYRKVSFSGGIVPEGDLIEQARQQLTHFEDALADLGGSYDDVTMMRWYIVAEHLSPQTQQRLHEIRAEFFDRPHYPASTMVGVASLLNDALVEIEMEAEIPDDEWDIGVIEADDEET